ncbi:MAG: ATP-binding protein [Myxococcales bacterium]
MCDLSLPCALQSPAEAAMEGINRSVQMPLADARPVRPIAANERLLGQVIEALPLGLAVVDSKGDVLFANSASTRVWGGTLPPGMERYEKGKGSWHHSRKRIAPDEWPSARTLRTGETCTGDLMDVETLDGRQRIITTTSVPIREERGIAGAVIVNEDVTDRVRSEEALRKTQRLLVEAAELGHTGSWEHDLVTGEVFNTEENRRLFFGNDRTKGSDFEDFRAAVHPEDRAYTRKRREHLIADGNVRDLEFRVVWPDGSVHVIHGLFTAVRDQAGRAVRVYGTNVDVTERRRAEEEMAQKARQQAAIAQISLSALGGQEIQPVLEEAAALVARTLRVEYCVVVERLPDEDAIIFRAGSGPWDAEPGKRIEVGPQLTRWLTSSARAPVVIQDEPGETSYLACQPLLEHAVKSGVNVPVLGHDRPFGVLGAYSTRPRTFAPDEIHFVWSVANVLAAFLEQKRVANELRMQREHLQALSRRLLDAQEAERRAIARELHDDFGAMLSAIKLNLMKKEGAAGASRPETLGLVDQAIQQVRDLAADLRPALLDDLGLAQALRWYAGREAGRAGLDLDLDLDDVSGRLPSQVETACFRIVQEALTNVVRHAGARRLTLKLAAEPDTVWVEVRDDGVGFDVRAARGTSQGLSNMHERAALAGGELRIESGTGNGTSIRASFPVTEGRTP